MDVSAAPHNGSVGSILRADDCGIRSDEPDPRFHDRATSNNIESAHNITTIPGLPPSVLIEYITLRRENRTMRTFDRDDFISFQRNTFQAERTGNSYLSGYPSLYRIASNIRFDRLMRLNI
jgi:hypothetical protein